MEVPLIMLLASLLLFTFLIAIDATSVVLTVTNITTDLGGTSTESFWIGASYLLAMCISQPIIFRLSDIFNRRSAMLASMLMIGIGSLVCESAATIALLLAGRVVQGCGAGGLTVLSYALYGDLGAQRGLRFLTAISLSIAAGTVCGPVIGAALSNGDHWKWIFRMNIPFCLLLGVVVYNASDMREVASHAGKLSDLDFLGAALLVTSVVPLLVGLSLAGSLYRWTDWQVIASIALGGASLLLLVGKEAILRGGTSRVRSGKIHNKPLLGLRLLGSLHGAATFGGAVFLGVLMYALLFFLPIYYRVIQERSTMTTSLLLLSQTLMMAPCAGVVLFMVQVLGLSYLWTVLLGWACTSCGIGLLTLLSADKSVTTVILLNLLSGFGIGVLLPALALSAKDNAKNSDVLEAPMVLVFMRYLGSASGLVVVGLLFQRVLRYNLELTKFKSEAEQMTKYATTLMYSIREMPSSQDKRVLVQATEATLRTIWLALSVGSSAILLLSCVMVMMTMRRQAKAKRSAHELSVVDASKLVLDTDSERDVPRVEYDNLKAFQKDVLSGLDAPDKVEPRTKESGNRAETAT